MWETRAWREEERQTEERREKRMEEGGGGKGRERWRHGSGKEGSHQVRARAYERMNTHTHGRTRWGGRFRQRGRWMEDHVAGRRERGTRRGGGGVESEAR